MAETLTTLQPVQKSERIQLLDVLRGFAIFGIFIMNLESYTFYWVLTDEQKARLAFAPYDHTIRFLHHMFFEGKFYSIFSMLFGIGFAIYLAKADENKNILNLFKRRLAFLLLIGFIHLLLWTGDIVAFYAMLGFLLIPFRKFNNKTLLFIAGLCILLPIALYAVKMINPDVFNLARWFYMLGENLSANMGITSGEEYYKVATGTNPLKILEANLYGIFFRYGDLIFQSRMFKVLGMFFLGLVIGRTKFYNRLHQNKRLLWTILITGVVIGVPANYIMARFMEGAGYYRFNVDGLYQTIAYSFGVAPLALAYASLVALLYQSQVAKKILDTLAPAGRMALTNYIMHTFIGLFVFTNLGLGISSMGPTAWTLFAVFVFVFQIIASTIWLRFFNYGPLEWLWRSLTYWKRQPMRKENSKKLKPATGIA